MELQNNLSQVKPNAKMASELWAKLSKPLEQKLGDTIWDQWFEDIIPLFKQDQTLYLQAPGKFHALWISNNYMDILDELLGNEEPQTKVKVLMPEEQIASPRLTQ